MNTLLRLSAPALALSLFACASQKHAEPAMQLAAGQTPPAEMSYPSPEDASLAVSRLATGRCLGSERCSGRFVSEDGSEPADPSATGYQECLNFYRDEATSLVEACGPAGVNQEHVRRCAERWSMLEDCSRANDSVSSLDACSPERICR